MPDNVAVEQFKASLRGELLQPNDPGYDEARSIWNGMIDRRPALIAQCLGVPDVVNCVNFAREQGLPLSIKGGGHNIAGLALCDDALMVDLSLMRGVWVDEKARTAHAQPGCQLGDVDSATQLYGLAAVLGFVSTTGIAGLTLGGGFGYLTRKFGWTSDTLRSLQVVTADGQVLRASEEEHGDLFWALRGGGGNFGIVTNFEYNLYPVGPEIMAGAIVWRLEEAEAVLEMLRTVSEQAPPELTCVGGLRMAPPAPWIDKELHGKPVVALFICHSGSIEEGKKLVAPIKNFGSPVGDVIQPRSYMSQQSILDATQPKGRRYYWKSEYLPKLDPAMFDKAIKYTNNITSPHSAILLFPLDGALNQLPDDHSPVGNRDAAWVINIAAAWDQATDDHVNIEWARQTWRDLREFSTGGTYINFLTGDEGDERTRAAYGQNYRRLVEAKTKWDPDNLFKVNKNIPPKGS